MAVQKRENSGKGKRKQPLLCEKAAVKIRKNSGF